MLALENFKTYTVFEMEKMKDAKEHIEELDTFLEKFDEDFEKVIRTVKTMNINSLRKDLKEYQREWVDNFNKELVNSSVKNKKLEKLEFENYDFLGKVHENPQDIAIPNMNVFKKSRSSLTRREEAPHAQGQT